MKSHSEVEFERLYPIYKIREKEIPIATRSKMSYIASLIHGQTFNSTSYFSSKSQQAEEISSLDNRALSVLFNTIAQTLLFQKKTFSKQVKVKFGGFFEFWKEARVKIEPKHILISCENLQYKYQLSEMSMGNCRRSKNTFQLYQCNKSIATFKTSSNNSFDSLIGCLQSSIDETKKSSQNQSLDILQKYQMEPEQQISSYQSKQQKKLRKESIEEQLIKIEDAFRKEVMEGFKIVQEVQNMYILEADKQPKIHINLILKTNCDLSRLVNFYVQQKQWNSAIIQQNIVERQQNLLQIFRVFKKDSIFQMERATLTMAKFFCSKNAAIIQEETVNHEKSGKKDNKLVCSVRSSSSFKRCLGGIKITLSCFLDGKGFFSVSDSCSLLKRWYRDIKYLENNYTLAELQKNNLRIFVTKDIRLSRNSWKEESLPKIALEKEMSTNDTLDLAQLNEPESNLQKLYLKLKPTKPYEQPSDDYISLTLNKLNQKYYLKYRFDQSPRKQYDTYTPTYCLSEMLKRKQYKVSDKKQLVFIDQEVIDGQKDSLIFVIKQIGANIVSGKSVLNVSLPVDIFQSRSLLERSAASFGIVPDYLFPIAEADPLTQIKSIITLFSNLPTLELIMLKPFNPILGETFQAYIKGIPIYYEQVSHHPPISSFYMTCPQFTLHGNLVAFADVSLNSAVGGNQGITYIKMKNGNQFQCYFPPCQISGLIFGERSFRAYGKGFILCKEHNLMAEISIQKAKKGLYEKGKMQLFPGTILGGIFKVRSQVIRQLAQGSSLRKYSGLSSKDVEEKLASIEGIWFEDIYINNQILNRNIKTYPLQYPKITLPSDSNYREDVLYHKRKDIPRSQREKQVLEVRQRGDRKLREKHAKNLKKKK